MPDTTETTFLPPLSRRRFLGMGAAATALAAVAPAALRGGIASATTLAPNSRWQPATSSASGTVSFLSWDTIAVMQPVVALFKKMNPKVTVELEFENPNTYVDTLATRLLAGTAPDVFIYTAQNKAALNAGDYVLELTDHPSTKVMAAANRNFMSNGDKVYGFSPARRGPPGSFGTWLCSTRWVACRRRLGTTSWSCAPSSRRSRSFPTPTRLRLGPRWKVS